MRNAWLLLVPGLWLVACGWESDGAARLAERYDDAATTTDVTADEATPPDVDFGDVGGTGLTGRWAVQVVVTGTMAPIGISWDYTETTYFLSDVADGAVTADWIYCDQVNDVPKSPNPTSQPQALHDLLASKPLRVTLSADGVMPSALIWTWGLDRATLGDEKPEALSATSEGVIDEDEDQQPGVTLEVLTKAGAHFASRYLARWERFDLQAGSLSEDGLRIEGVLAADAIEFALGADNAVVNRDSKLAVTPGTGHTWRLRRVPADYTCDTLKTDAAGLFPTP